jgi:signal transduction histidine kinase
MLAITLSFLAITGLILINSFFEQYRHVLKIFNVVDPHLRWEFIADEIFYANITRLIICFAIFLIILFTTIFRLTHRFYGPIIAINRFISELKKGNYSARITLRQKDELQDVAKHLNELAESLGQKK